MSEKQYVSGESAQKPKGTAAMGKDPSDIIYPLPLSSGGGSIPVNPSGTPAPANPGATALLTVTDLVAVAVIATVDCSRVQVIEDASVANWPTTPYYVRKGSIGATPIEKFMGTPYDFPAPPGTYWTAGDTVGWLQLPATGSTTFSRDMIP